MESAPQITEGNEKQLCIYRMRNGNLEIKWSGGGEVPQVLLGEWTSYKMAQSAIATYLNMRPAKRGTSRKS